jgi:hypothetical protein
MMYDALSPAARPPRRRPTEDQRRAVREQMQLIATVLADSGSTLTLAEAEGWVAATREDAGR